MNGTVLTSGPAWLWIAAAVAVARTFPIVVSTLVLAWHSLRGSAPGAAGRLLVQLAKTAGRFPRRRWDGTEDRARQKNR